MRVFQLVCNSTGIHELVGQVSGFFIFHCFIFLIYVCQNKFIKKIKDFLLSPDWFGVKIVRNKEIQNIQCFTQSLTLAALTGLRNPKITENWSHLFVALKNADFDNQSEKHFANINQIYDTFRNQLKNLGSLIALFFWCFVFYVYF